MTTAQKIIKNLAIAFAIFLIITIISTSLSVLYGITKIFGLKKDDKASNVQMTTTDINNTNVDTLEIDVITASLTIKTGKNFKIDTNNNDITCKQNSNTVQIKEKNHNWFTNTKEQDLIVYIPEDLEFEKVKINSGAGKIEIENLTTQKLTFELGAGETKIENLNVLKDCEIEGGAGRTSILSGEIKNLDLDIGVGETNLNSKLTGKSEINSGIGNLNITLQGSKEDYKIKADKGIGNIKIDGKEISNSTSYGDGENTIDINGGIGSIKINFENDVI